MCVSFHHNTPEHNALELQYAFLIFLKYITQPVFTCVKLTIETLEQSVKYVQS